MKKKYFAYFIIYMSVCMLYACTASKKTQNENAANQNIKTQASSPKKLNAQDSINIQRNFIDACRAKVLGDNDGAIALFKEVLKADPQNDAALYELAKIYFNYGRMDDARELARLAVAADTGNKYYRSFYANVLVYESQYNDAAKMFEQLIKQDPLLIDNYFQLSFVYEKAGSINDAITILKDAENKFGVSENVLLEQQRLYVKSGNFADAINTLQKLIALNPDEPSYYSMLVEVYQAAGKNELALETFNTLLQVDPDNPDLLFKKAEFEKQAGNMQQYYSDLRKAFANPNANIDRKIFFLVPYIDSIGKPAFVQKDTILAYTALLVKAHPADAKAYAMRGDFLYYNKQLTEARTAYRQSVNLRSDIFDVWTKLFYIDSDARNYDSLAQVTDEAIELFPGQPLTYFFNGIALMNLMKEQDAIASFKRAIPLTNSNTKLRADIYLRLGNIYNDLKNYSESDKAYETSLSLEPLNPYALNNYAYFLSVRNERLDKAAEMALKAIDITPNNSSVEDTYAWILFKQQKYADAKMWVQKALKDDAENNPVIIEHYGDILFKLNDVDGAVKQWEKAKALGKASDLIDKKIADRMYYE